MARSTNAACHRQMETKKTNANTTYFRNLTIEGAKCWLIPFAIQELCVLRRFFFTFWPVCSGIHKSLRLVNSTGGGRGMKPPKLTASGAAGCTVAVFFENLIIHLIQIVWKKFLTGLSTRAFTGTIIVVSNCSTWVL